MATYPVVFSATPVLVGGLRGSVAFVASHMLNDFERVLGVACGALLYLTRSHETTTWRKAIYFVVSLVGGNVLARRIVLNWPQVEPWLAGFIASAALVTFTIIALDWSERHVEPTLDRLYAWIVRRLLKG
ncbi:putative holin [Paraburkholderia dioscoreae]|uniref:Phage holin n=1 Tax=Paraburkholderia dioscoreae TaxID=2604047 RepID=A0A5Q4Z1U9_9BURK|nr:putative holin [Paraburkholderia dioscoreae]VVD27802.1 conserved membrane protein of unknown function [Paraburkholderia dioscoreae]